MKIQFLCQCPVCDHLVQCPENTAASHHSQPLPVYAHLGLQPTTQCFPGHHKLSACFKQVSIPCGPGQQPSSQKFLGQHGSSCAEGGDSGCHQGSAHAHIPPDQYGPRLGPSGKDLILKRWCPPVSHTCLRLYIRTPMVPVPSAPMLKPRNSVLPCMSLGFLSFHPSTRKQVNAHERSRLCAGSTGGHLGFQPPSTPPPGKGQSILADFYFHMLWKLFFFAQDTWAGEPGMGLGAPPSSGGISATEVSLPAFNYSP